MVGSIFDELVSRPVPARCSDVSMLDLATPIAVDCEPRIFQQLSRQWHDRDTARDLDAALHRIELERAARPPVIEVTVTVPPEGIPRAGLHRLVRGAVTEFSSGGPVTREVRVP